MEVCSCGCDDFKALSIIEGSDYCNNCFHEHVPKASLSADESNEKKSKGIENGKT